MGQNAGIVAGRRTRKQFQTLGLGGGAGAVDLGRGNGLQSIASAELGYAVLALDTSASLLAELRERAGALPIRCVQDDLCVFPAYLDGPAQVIVCMGDTLTHLPTRASVDQLLTDVAEHLAPAGVLVLSFRDYVSSELAGTTRFIPVRSDDHRILTCFLEYGPDTVEVHDLVHERDAHAWRMAVSRYRNLRLSPHAIAMRLDAVGLTVRFFTTERGLATLVASRPAG